MNVTQRRFVGTIISPTKRRQPGQASFARTTGWLFGWLFDRQEAEGNAPSRGLPPAFPSPFTKSALSPGLAPKVEVPEF